MFTFNINNEWLETFNCPRIICRCLRQEILKRKTFDRKLLKIKGSRAFLVNIWPTKIGHHKAFTKGLKAFSERFSNYTSFYAFSSAQAGKQETFILDSAIISFNTLANRWWPILIISLRNGGKGMIWFFCCLLTMNSHLERARSRISKGVTLKVSRLCLQNYTHPTICLYYWSRDTILSSLIQSQKSKNFEIMIRLEP